MYTQIGVGQHVKKSQGV